MSRFGGFLHIAHFQLRIVNRPAIFSLDIGFLVVSLVSSYSCGGTKTFLRSRNF